jgi:HK97 family phage prohead protease
VNELIIERRTLVEPVEFRSLDGGKRIVATGVAIRYGAISKNMGGFKERIMPGAATKTLQERDVLMLHEHERRMILGRVSAGTLRITNDERELAYEVDLPDTTYGRDLAESLERRDITGSSFGFKAIPADTRWTAESDGLALRSVGAMMLDHLSTTSYPAYDAHTAEYALRSLADQTGQDHRALVDAAKNGLLPTLISPPDDGGTEDHEEEPPDGRETTVYRRPLTWRY